MRPRIPVAVFLTKLGRFVSSLALMVMRPDDLQEYGRRRYATARIVNYWGSDNLVTGGLTPLETTALEKTGLSGGRALVLAMGGGREAIPLARMGFAVTGLDYIPAAVEMARENAAKQGVQLDAQVGDYAALATLPGGFDLAVFTCQMYSSIPTRKRRLGLLKKIHAALKPGGWFLCGFWWNPVLSFSPRVEWLRKMFACLSLGNFWYEPGDVLGGVEFIHAFRSEAELVAEFTAGGFAVTYLHIPSQKDDTVGMALLQKA
jgi:SAM-dependent methyltransferase